MRAGTIVLSLLLAVGVNVAHGTESAAVDRRVDRLLKQMTLEEKVGQLTQYSAESKATGPVAIESNVRDGIRSGRVGSVFSVVGTNSTRQYQELALQSRLKIPLLFGMDVIHGYKTTFPIPLAEVASWDLEAIQRSARVAATEAAAGGIHWTFAPMVDIARDPRWGRVMEGAGEDTYLASRVAAARVKGFQGRQLGDADAVMACVKHFAGYGAAVGGRDYNSVDMSERMLWETYLPPFKAALDAGASTFMTSFNDLNGVPATGNSHLLRDILKGKWGFTGFVVSDWRSVDEMVDHGYAADNKDAARIALNAGVDMDMQSGVYQGNLVQLVREKKVKLADVDDAVRRILRKKFELGLFEDPYKFSDAERERQALNNPEHRKAARDIAAKSIVLLKNDGAVLPLSKSVRKLALIGPMIKQGVENHGFWSVTVPGVDYAHQAVSTWDGIAAKLGKDTTLLYAKGSDIDGEDRSGFAEAVRVASEADAVVIEVGERWDASGESRSRANPTLPGGQEDLIKAIVATGKPVVVMINAGRPLVFDWVADHAPAILYTWWLGSEAGNAVADVLFGDVNPSAKLPMTFPRSVGQIPIYYNHFNTGRPAPTPTTTEWVSGYIDLVNLPRFPFGFGLSYTTFRYDDLRLDRETLRGNDKLQVRMTLTNTGKAAGEEVVQLYLRDRVASVVRPVKELKGFQKVALAPGETRTVEFTIDKESLSFFNSALRWDAEPGEFDLMVGASSDDIRLRSSFQYVR
ncbi:beta-glucosidase BglX [Massilia sp. TW-1]|uniref:beta-glucosidase n=1 Tax=Telluria antibiotica TaxID=2717319 RepID=A0ABX0PG62_9BURK|nr:beta-glucosidase BglX [Telluria antibiotica]NIA56420.1 beta-glucosidase BglX [Telluria antibiotica]